MITLLALLASAQAGIIAVKTESAAQYAAGKTAAQGGTVFGVSVTLLASHDGSQRLVIETPDMPGHTAMLAELMDRPVWTVEARRSSVGTLGEMYQENPTLAAYFYALGAQ